MSDTKTDFLKASDLITVSSKFCKICRKVLPESFALSDHNCQRVSTVDKYAVGVKRKLHEIISDNKKNEKHLVKAPKMKSDCNESLNVVTTGSLKETLYPALEIAAKKC